METRRTSSAVSDHNLAETLRALGDLAGARTLGQQVLHAHQRLLGKEHSDTRVARANLDAIIHAQSDDDDPECPRR